MSRPYFRFIGDVYLTGCGMCAFPIGMALGVEESLRKQPRLSRMVCKSLAYIVLYPLSIPYMSYTFSDD